MAFSDLPSDMMPEIVSRLPVKSLFRFRSVSKTWRCIIEDLKFIKSYKFRPQSQIFVLHSDRSTFTVRCSKTFRVNAEYSFPNYIVNIREVIGSVDGLLLIESWDTWLAYLHLWNPCIGKTRILPHTPPEGERRLTWAVGLGFDPSIEDYKHVRIAFNTDLRDGTDWVMVYTVGTNSWKTIPFKTKDDKPWRFSRFGHGHQRVRFGKAFYSIAPTEVPNDTTPVKKLVSFDLSTEEFSSASLPEESLEGQWFLKCARGYSRLAAILIKGGKWSEWWAQGDGGGVTWSKHYTFDLTSYPMTGIASEVSNFDVNKVVWLTFEAIVILYDVESEEKKFFLDENIRTISHVSPYTESLALLMD